MPVERVDVWLWCWDECALLVARTMLWRRWGIFAALLRCLRKTGVGPTEKCPTAATIVKRIKEERAAEPSDLSKFGEQAKSPKRDGAMGAFWIGHHSR